MPPCGNNLVHKSTVDLPNLPCVQRKALFFAPVGAKKVMWLCATVLLRFFLGKRKFAGARQFRSDFSAGPPIMTEGKPIGKDLILNSIYSLPITKSNSLRLVNEMAETRSIQELGQQCLLAPNDL